MRTKATDSVGRRSIAIVAAAWIAFAVAVLTAGRSASDTGPSDFFSIIRVDSIEAERYDSIAEMRDNADAVVVGSIINARAGRSIVTAPDHPGGGGVTSFVLATVEVEEVLGGALIDGQQDRIQLEFFVPFPVLVAPAVASAPTGRAVLFLRHKGSEAASLGLTAAEQRTEWPYYRLVVSRALIRDRDGRIEMPPLEINFPGEPPSTASDYLSELNGRPFAEFVGGLRK